jgi:uncharacterized protein with FMN-binding domain
MTSLFRSSGFGTLGLLSVVPLLASCAAAGVAELDATTEGVDTSTQESSTPMESVDSVGSEAPVSEGDWEDGTYSSEGGYQSPNGPETVVVSLTLANNVVTDISVTPNATNSTSQRYQGQFAEGIVAETVGKPLGALQVSRVSGSSLTSGGFNQALEAIKADASR